ncbi:hypothetical protein NE897_01025 [Yersinia ruckeri]|uniref:Uncharacterized protein n=1 Tax=Yersinia ruckeri TaxID=29486 RepID=A0A085U7T3_YERRU|nr:hypothetical protein [Yersinia ruckeri]AKA37314.1 hypothetical protein UGYR_02160 [Yersinia ruckeri]ARZ00947.1 hypothetical protein QMA0440_01610 [Yersinia ruckeri]EEQ00517.1 hypothetical protein yruck0001_13400 [Yersinia ruckeri ATCC 29473]EKN3346376.1 hypothetical protein [Yersinia ruckeri]EKN3360872.1 hypothetical protein [Yersinia ruckeri]
MKKIMFSLLLLLGMTEAPSATIDLWREPIPEVKAGQYYSLIVDRGELQKAIKDSNNEYVFSEKCAGTKPLVLIGTSVEITEFLLNNETSGIENHITELPDIYMGITKYVAKERFTGLFPLNYLLISTVEQTQKFLPFGTLITDAAGIPDDLKALYQSLHKLDRKQKESGQVLYVKFSYLPEKGMRKVGKKTISFGKILKIMQSRT